MIIRLAEEGFKIIEVPINFKIRKYGKSRLISNPLSYGFRALSIITRTFRDYHPMKFFGISGIILLIAGGALGTIIIYDWWQTGFEYISKQPRITLSALLIMSGLQLLIFGFLADMISSIRKLVLEERKSNRK